MKEIGISIEELVKMVKSKRIILPEMQRRYVWTATKVRDLLDSLYREYPTGTILLWEQQDEVKHSKELSVNLGESQSIYNVRHMLLDGQQRLTSLAALLEGKPIKVKNSEREIEILFNLEHPAPHDPVAFSERDQDLDEDDELDEEDSYKDGLNLQNLTFVVYSKAIDSKRNWIKVTDIFQKSGSQILKELGLHSDDPEWDRYIDRIAKVQAIKKYSYIVDVLGSKYDYDEVTEIFVRVNSAGAKLTGSDLALAQIASKWQGCLKILEEFIDDKQEDNFTLPLDIVVRALVVYATNQCTFKAVGNLSGETLEKSWEKTKKGLDYALNFLRNNTWTEDLGLLSSPFIIVPIAYFSSIKDESLSNEEERNLTRWIYLANTFSHYSVSSESALNADLNILKRAGTMSELIEIIERKNGRLQINKNDLKGRGRRNPLFAMSYMAAKSNDAKDWFTGLGISIGTKGKYHRLQAHHIFPKKILQNAKYDRGEINEIANLAFISGRTNRRIAAKEPKVYFEKIINERGERALADQFVPLNKELWHVENYRHFLTERRKLIAEAVNKILNPAAHS